jgi:hypothetical protein
LCAQNVVVGAKDPTSGTLCVNGTDYSTPTDLANALSTLASSASLSALAVQLCTANPNPCPKAYAYYCWTGKTAGEQQSLISGQFITFNNIVFQSGITLESSYIATITNPGLYLVMFSVTPDTAPGTSPAPHAFGPSVNTHPIPFSTYLSQDQDTGFNLMSLNAGNQVLLANYGENPQALTAAAHAYSTFGTPGCTNASPCLDVKASLLIMQLQ